MLLYLLLHGPATTNIKIPRGIADEGEHWASEPLYFVIPGTSSREQACLLNVCILLCHVLPFLSDQST